MAKTVHGTASWPGAMSIRSCTYTFSKGITPGCALLVTNPQPTPPAMFGSLSISDGFQGLTLRDCKVDQFTSDTSSSGISYQLRILDRRWKWYELGEISGVYNQLDKYGKLIPWTIRSPTEMVLLCLQAMGELPGFINMPKGLTRKQGIAFSLKNPPWLGVIPAQDGDERLLPAQPGQPARQVNNAKKNPAFMKSTPGINPPVNWNHEPPANALSSLVNRLGREVCLQLSNDRVSVTINGQGSDLPFGGLSIQADTPSIKTPSVPAGCKIVGAPIRSQPRLFTEAVGREWNGYFLPIDQLSYAPKTPGRKQKSKFTVINPQIGDTYKIWINYPDGRDFRSGAEIQYVVETGDDAASVAFILVDLINNSNDPRIKNIVFPSSVGGQNYFNIEAAELNVAFTFQCQVDGVGRFFGETQILPGPQITSWQMADLPLFSCVTATDRLTKPEAMRYAQEHIFKSYRITGRNYTGASRLKIPGLGKIKRRQQLLLEMEQVEQVVPELIDIEVIDPRTNQPAVLDYYNGFSRNKPAYAYGATARGIQQFFHAARALGGSVNTRETDRIFTQFSLDATEQIFTFTNHVYYQLQHGVRPTDVVIQTAVSMRDEETNSPICSELFKLFPGQRGKINLAVRVYDDVQLNYIGEYSDNNRLTGFRELKDDTRQRANHYLRGMIDQYRVVGAVSRKYNGIQAIDLDGAISQVTWSVGESGAETSASKNTEHDPWVAPYPLRRRAEMLGPAQMARNANKNQLINMVTGNSLNDPDNPR